MTLRHSLASALAWAGLVAVVIAAAATASRAATEPGFPRLGIYSGIHGDGTPFYHAPADTTLDATVLDDYARYDQVILDLSPITPYRSDILAELRRRNPNLRALAYVTGNNIWPAASVDSLNHYPTRYRRMIRDLGGFLYNSFDGSEFPYSNVNIAKRDANGRFVVAEGIADLYADVVQASGAWDGVFIDEFCQDPTWMEDATHHFDYVRAGYPTYSAFLAAWQAGSDTLANRLRRRVGPSLRLVGNCGESAHQGVFNGWMREDFPFQRAGTWFDNMLRDPRGYLADDRDYAGPTSNYLSTWLTGPSGTEYSPTNTRKVRFGLASAALGDGYGVFGSPSNDFLTYPHYRWWYDEYAVDLATGRSASGPPHTHWLGQPLGPPYQMIWVGGNPDAVTNPNFETDVTTGWRFGVFSPATASIERDTTTAAVGRASAHVTIPTAGAVGWDVNLTTTSSVQLFTLLRYAATFWARASSPRTITVVAPLTGGGEAASARVAIGTEWKQYQLVLLPTLNARTTFEFFLGLDAGEVWLDDVHFQAGETSLWRRDFDNGAVLLNPGTDALSVPMGAGWRRILGTADPSVNDGGPAETALVPPSDALFLIAPPRDLAPPGRIGDAHVQP